MHSKWKLHLKKWLLKQGENKQDEYFRDSVTGSILLSHQEKWSISCLCCKKPHESQNSCIVLGIWTRKIVQTSKQCFVCLAGSHLIKDFSLKIKSFKCSKRHQIALCDFEENCRSSNNSSSVTNVAGVDDNTVIFFQTDKVKAKTFENSHATSAGVFFDNCSQ